MPTTTATGHIGATASEIHEALTYRAPMQVTEVLKLPFSGYAAICPRCNQTLEREYQSYCDRCGQHLNWKGYNKATVLKWEDYRYKTT